MIETKIEYADEKNGKVAETTEWTERIPEAQTQEADFETAIKATGYGKFNWLLLAAIIPSSFSQVYETESMGYILPIAQCDLDLTLESKGTLNSICHMGMIFSGFVWGYLIDVFGRRRVMMYGYFLDAVVMLAAGMSQSFTMLMISKFLGGFIVSGPFSAAASFLSEFHASNYRAKVHIARGITLTLGSLSLPLIAWVVLPLNIDWQIMEGFKIHSWNLFFIICSLSPFIGSIAFYLLPESPKFLMSAGRNAEALSVLQKVYSLNTGKPKNTYSIIHLKNEIANSNFPKNPTDRRSSLYITIQRGLFNLKPLFARPHIYRLINTCLNVYLFLMATNTLKFWMPQLLSSASDYQQSHNGSSSNTCDMLEGLTHKVPNNAIDCSVSKNTTSVYINAAIIGVSQIVGFVFVSTLVNLVGKKSIVVIILTITGISGICVYIAPNMTVLMLLFCIFISCSVVATNVTMTITLELFPTVFRTSALSIYLMSGRAGSITGNSVFPHLLNAGCLPPFLFLGFIMFGASCLTLLYPSTENKSLE